jgi:hypothetical protein
MLWDEAICRRCSIAWFCNRLANQGRYPEASKDELEIARGSGGALEMDAIGRRCVLACSDWGGSISEIGEEDMSRYRSHAGHAYSAELISRIRPIAPSFFKNSLASKR